jgi:hypothetical protein
MHIIIVMTLIAGVALVVFVALMALQPAWPLGDFRPGHEVRERHFRQSPDVVIDAYRRAALLSPGVVVADAEPDVLYLEVRTLAAPLTRDRSFVLRVIFVPAPDGGTTVRTCAQRPSRRERARSTATAAAAAEAELSTTVIDRGLTWRLAGLW